MSVTDDENMAGTSVVKIKEEIITMEIKQENNKNYGHSHFAEIGAYYPVSIKIEPIDDIEQPKTLDQCAKKHEVVDNQLKTTSQSLMVAVQHETDDCEAGAGQFVIRGLSPRIKTEPAVDIAGETQVERAALSVHHNVEIVAKIKQETEEVGCGSVQPLQSQRIEESEGNAMLPEGDSYKNKSKGYRCDPCNVEFRWKSLFTSHMKSHEEKQFICSVCGFASISRKGLRAHERRNTHIGARRPIKEKKKPYECTMCGFKTSLKRYLTAHETGHTRENPYKCDYCGYKTVYKFTLSKHIRTHTADKPYKCDDCNYKAIFKSSLLRHALMHTGDKPYGCTLCGYKTATRSRLTDHARIHTGNTYNCSYCDFKTTHQSSLMLHHRMHTGEKPYECSLCDFKATSKKYLTIHEKRHNSKKPHGCSVCGYTTFSKDYLKIHMRKHTNERPFECSICDFKTSQKGSLKMHIRTHTGEKPFKCSMCDFRTAHQGT